MKLHVTLTIATSLLTIVLAAAPALAEDTDTTTPPTPSDASVATPSATPPPGELAPATTDSTDEPIEEVVTEVAPVAEDSYFDSQAVPQTDRAVNVLFARPTRRNSLLVVIEHRALETFVSKRAGEDYLGLDAGLKVGLGLRYGILDNLDVGLYRLNNKVEIFDTYDFDARLRVLEQRKHFVDAAVRAGATVFVQHGKGPASGFSAQALVNRTLFDRLLLGVGFGFHSQSSNAWKRTSDDEFSGAVLAVVEWRILRKLAWDVEMGANVLGYGSKYPTLATSLKLMTYRHTFALVFSNNDYMATDGYITNTEQKPSKPLLGFQITREFNL